MFRAFSLTLGGMERSVTFSDKTVKYIFNQPFSSIATVVDKAACIIITDSNVAAHYSKAFEGYKAVIVLPAGEEHKCVDTILSITDQLIAAEAHRQSFLLGVGGGVVTDIVGFVANIYMRGVSFGFVPSSLLGMVDAAIGGKNGINHGKHKNLIGSFKQPDFILFDTQLLNTLPAQEWANGFAEVIKYSCLFDEALFTELANNNINFYKKNEKVLNTLIERCVNWKNEIVCADEQEKGNRKLLNFGHTVGHAYETVCKIPHGQAVALGMLVACTISTSFGFDQSVTEQLRQLIQQYELPTTINADTDQLMAALNMDKKRDATGVDFIVLKAIGDATVQHISFDTIRKGIEDFNHASNH